MLRSILSGGLTMQDALMEILAVVMIVFLILPLHELAHGFIAYKLGDNTAKIWADCVLIRWLMLTLLAH